MIHSLRELAWCHKLALSHLTCGIRGLLSLSHIGLEMEDAGAAESGEIVV